MEEVENFYLNIVADLKEFQSNKLKKIHLLKSYVIKKNGRLNLKDKLLLRKNEKQRKAILEGYYKGIEDCLKIVMKDFKELKKCSLKD